MNKTGTYVWDPDLQRLVKVSDRIPKVDFGVTVPEGGYLSTNMEHQPVWVGSRRQKRAELESRGLREYVTSLSRREL